MEELLQDLDAEQRLVATTFGAPVAVIAGAGTGKTRAITHRIAYGSRVGAYDPNAILAVTFTTKAAGEMRSRLRTLGFAGVQARTFHSAALRQAQYFWPKIMGSTLPEVTERTMSLVAEAARHLGIRLDKGGLRDAVTEIGWAKVSNVLPDDYPEMAASLGRNVSSISPVEIAKLARGYEDVKRQRHVIDFDDILLLACALLTENPQVAAEVQRTYRHFIVDEFQDVSPLQHRLLSLWLGPQPDLCVVGDPAQTIHSFAGATADYLTKFLRSYPNAVSLRLVRDYRSTPEIVSLANSVMAQSGAVKLQPVRAPGPKPQLRGVNSPSDEADLVADWLRASHDRGVSWAEMAVLMRINAQSPALEASLTEADIPYVLRDSTGFFERSEIRQALHLLGKLAENDLADPLALTVFEALGWHDIPPSGGGSARERWESLAALRAIIDEMIADDGELTIADLLGELGYRQNVAHPPAADAVTLSTIHSAKGLEWEAVAICNAHEGSIPYVLATSAAALAEERRLLYVAITRAKTELLITWSGGRNGTRRVSRFLQHLSPTGPLPAKPAPRKSALAKTCRVCAEPLATPADRKLGRHLDCPAAYDEATWEALRAWRLATAKAESFPAFVVFTDATLMAIAEARPRTETELLKLSGVGPAKAQKYGAAVIEVLRRHTDSPDVGPKT